MKEEFGCERITIQTGGTLNGLFLRNKLFDYVDIVIARVLVGGKDTTTLIDGDFLYSLTPELDEIQADQKAEVYAELDRLEDLETLKDDDAVFGAYGKYWKDLDRYDQVAECLWRKLGIHFLCWADSFVYDRRERKWICRLSERTECGFAGDC